MLDSQQRRHYNARATEVLTIVANQQGAFSEHCHRFHLTIMYNIGLSCVTYTHTPAQ